jgi:hypothetical protein
LYYGGVTILNTALRIPEALEPIRQRIKDHFGAFSAGAADGLKSRNDHGSVYMSGDFQPCGPILWIQYTFMERV